MKSFAICDFAGWFCFNYQRDIQHTSWLPRSLSWTIILHKLAFHTIQIVAKSNLRERLLITDENTALEVRLHGLTLTAPHRTLVSCMSYISLQNIFPGAVVPMYNVDLSQVFGPIGRNDVDTTSH